MCIRDRVLYVSGEESTHQLKLRARRLQVDSASLYVLSETGLDLSLIHIYFMERGKAFKEVVNGLQ